jgi:hypothetical protein
MNIATFPLGEPASNCRNEVQRQFVRVIDEHLRSFNRRAFAVTRFKLIDEQPSRKTKSQ